MVRVFNRVRGVGIPRVEMKPNDKINCTKKNELCISRYIIRTARSQCGYPYRFVHIIHAYDFIRSASVSCATIHVNTAYDMHIVSKLVILSMKNQCF